MIELTGLQRKVILTGVKKAVYVKPPTLRQAVEILTVVRETTDAGDVKLLFELLSGLDWSGPIDILVHLRKQLAINPAGFQQTIRSIIMQGYQVPHKYIDEAENNESDRKVDWAFMISDYCRSYPGRDPWQVYNETPFPFFMEMIGEAKREHYRQQYLRSVTSSFAMGGNSKIQSKWYEKGWPEDQPPETIREVDEREIAQNRKAFKRALQ